ncbi:MAG: hypothetical protein ACRDL7_15245, partial [Gaiellaceae bacterium]
MNITIFQTVEACSILKLPDRDTRVDWGSSPIVGDLVKMGGEIDWEVVAVFPYQPITLIEEVETFYLAQVSRVDHPVPKWEDWSCNQHRYE